MSVHKAEWITISIFNSNIIISTAIVCMHNIIHTFTTLICSSNTY